jgi:tetratricopeptide (TPR) repeat protein
LLKSQNKWPKALEIWQNFIENGEEIMFSCEELAKYYEHKEKNIEKAIKYTDRALEFFSIVEEIQLLGEIGEKRGGLEHRLNRLVKKLKKRTI